jgi:16S rRNA (adenine1518-N6/adenine1519-N6)-dimethyltransferase
MLAEPSTPDFGRLTVMLQYRFEMELVLNVPPDAFWPPPKVDSAVVRMIPAPGRCGVAMDEAQLEELVTKAFSQRRKTCATTSRACWNWPISKRWALTRACGRKT